MSSTPRGRDTSLGGSRRRFPSTCWSRILAAREGEDERRTAVEMLAKTYWRPVYLYVRLRWSKSNEEAKDLTQDYFLWMIETNFVDRADPDRGRFRSFLRASLDHFLCSEDRKERRQKRGGDRQLLSLEGMPEDLGPTPLADEAAASPEQAMDQAWREGIFARALDLMKTAYRKEKRDVYFNIFREYFLSETSDASYKVLADKHGISFRDVSNYLMHAKARFRQVVRGLVAETVGNESDLRDEMEALFGESLD